MKWLIGYDESNAAHPPPSSSRCTGENPGPIVASPSLRTAASTPLRGPSNARHLRSHGERRVAAPIGTSSTRFATARSGPWETSSRAHARTRERGRKTFGFGECRCERSPSTSPSPVFDGALIGVSGSGRKACRSAAFHSNPPEASTTEPAAISAPDTVIVHIVLLRSRPTATARCGMVTRCVARLPRPAPLR